MEVDRISIASILVGERRRQLDASRVQALADSVKELGLRTPITVRIIPEATDADGVVVEDVPVLVAGLHRLEAAKLLGWEFIEAFTLQGDETDAELWEIDENLMRAELSPAQVSAHAARRKALWQERQNKRQSLAENQRGRPKEFVGETAEITGRAASGIRQAVRRAEQLGNDINEVTGTSLDVGVELDALAKLPASERRELIERAKAGEQVSARKPVKLADAPLNDFEIVQKQVAALMSAWNKAGPEAREQFLDRIDTPAFDRTKAVRAA